VAAVAAAQNNWNNVATNPAVVLAQTALTAAEEAQATA
jgi:hypothetical protein